MGRLNGGMKVDVYVALQAALLGALLMLVVPRGCCHATQCGTHTQTQASNNGLLYEVPTGAMVTSSFWAGQAEPCAKIKKRGERENGHGFPSFCSHVAQKPLEN